jgi:hypothetical protein
VLRERGVIYTLESEMKIELMSYTITIVKFNRFSMKCVILLQSANMTR